jgi:peptidyl-prolyl cis-trans isomerase A (cyclophilin A)
MKKQLLPSLVCIAVLAGCNSSKPSSTEKSEPAAQSQAQSAAPAPAPAPAPPGVHASASDLLTNPSAAFEKAPDVFRAHFTTTKGDFVIEVHREWAPLGADRFYNLVKIGYFDDVAFFRNVAGFMVQFGIHGRPDVNAAWHAATIQDDANRKSNTRGMVCFAMAGPNTRTTQLFITFGDSSFLDNQGFSPFGQVVAGMDVVDKLYNGYGEGAPQGRGPDQGRIQNEGNTYLHSDFPLLDYIKSAKVE